MDELDEAILVQFSQLIRDAGKFTTHLVTDGLTQKEQQHFAKRLAVLADTVHERAERTGKRTAKGNVSDISSAREDVSGSKAG
ncbi:hypothetical protein EDD99_5181 [Streptomyces sp. 846.5]|nr:hypothetical protein [Streptomyces sp. 846.5]TDU06618.1 hypothetical protein EDD99_5181 [Streptomyces sp. 846.5]